jgi:hypothetical protein
LTVVAAPGPTTAVPPTVEAQPVMLRHNAHTEIAKTPRRRICQAYGR